MFDHWEVNGSTKYTNERITVNENVTLTTIWVDLPIDHICQAEQVGRVEATQTENGKEAYYYCEGCGNAYEDEEANRLIEDLANWGIIQSQSDQLTKNPPTKPMRMRASLGGSF